LNMRRLELTLTTKCNSQCVYCQADASPLKAEVMSLEDINNYLDEAGSLSNLESFMVFGGEPMLFPEQAINAFERAHKQRIPKIEMLTNGFWGKDEQKARELAFRMEKSGLNTLGISVDAFHEQFIPLEYLQTVALASIHAGIADVAWNVAVVESVSGKNKYDRKTARLLKLLEPVGIETHVHKVLPVGRAARNLRRYLKREPLSGPCVGDPILENSLISPKCVTMEPSGEVDICWNLTIGNAKQKPLSQIIRDYEWKRNPIIRTLIEEGPIGLVKDAKRRGFQFRNAQHVNKCNLCIEVRRILGPTGLVRASS
jgi:MoaA/NifB/PqqE/SkfB family radical SAM enzyme